MSEKIKIEEVNKGLQLNGDKISLGVRPLNKLSTASSKSSLLSARCFARPVSALPLLFPTKDSNRSSSSENEPKCHKRPFSAGYNNYIYPPTIKINNTDASMDSIDSIPDETVASSSALLQSFLSEPIDGTILTPGVVTKPPLPPNKAPSLVKPKESNSISYAIHDYLTIKYEVNKGGSDDSSIKSIRLDDSTRNDNPEIKVENPENVKVQNWISGDEKAVPNVSDLDIDKLFADDNDEKFDNFFRDLGENEPNKLETFKKEKIKNKVKPRKPKVKFIATPMKSSDDYSARSPSVEIDTWMSSKSNKSSPVGDNMKKSTSESKKMFNDFLHNFEDLENFALGCDDDITEIPQRDNENDRKPQNESGSFDDIVSILQVLEQEDKKAQEKMENIKKIIDDEILSSPRALQSSSTSATNRTEAKSTSPVCSSETVTSTPIVIDNKKNDKNYRELLMFLDEVDRSCSKSLDQKPPQQFQNSLKISKINLETIPKIEDLTNLTKDELATQVVDLTLRLKEKSSSIGLLQNEMSSLREELTAQSKKSEINLRQKLKNQKEEYESAIKRHQKFIDQLINDKKVLNQQCENLVRDLKSLEDRYQSNLKALEHKHQVELQKCKEMHLASEKIKRDRWIDSKTQKIKELTVRSIEPELKSMEKRQMQEISEIRLLHAKEIEDLELKGARKMQEQCELIRVQMTEEREKALAHEREILRLRYDSLVENEEKSYQDLKKRLMQEHANKLEEINQREVLLQHEKENAIKKAQLDLDNQLQNCVRRHDNEVQLLKETVRLEFETWQHNFKKAQMLQLSKYESEIREKSQKERDKEIEKVIEKLEFESNENKVQMEKSMENRIQRLKSKYEKEISDLESLEKQSENKYKETKKRLIQSEDLLMNAKAAIKQSEFKINELCETVSKLENERQEIRNIIRKEMENDLERLEFELKDVKESRDKEIQQLYSRVKISVARKDELVEELTKERKALQEKCVYLENMLEQQRKDYLIK